MTSLLADIFAADPFPKSNKPLFCFNSVLGFLAVSGNGIVSTRVGGNKAPRTGSPPIPTTPVIGLAILGSLWLSSKALGASLGCRNAVDDLIAWSFRSSYRLGGYSLESADDMSRLMLIRLGEGASGGLDWLALGEASSPLHAVTMTADCQLMYARHQTQLLTDQDGKANCRNSSSEDQIHCCHSEHHRYTCLEPGQQILPSGKDITYRRPYDEANHDKQDALAPRSTCFATVGIGNQPGHEGPGGQRSNDQTIERYHRKCHRHNGRPGDAKRVHLRSCEANKDASSNEAHSNEDLRDHAASRCLPWRDHSPQQVLFHREPAQLVE